MYVWTGGNRHKLAEIFQNQLAQVGINAKIEIMDIGTMNARVRQQNETTDESTPGHLRHDDLGLVRPGHPVRAVALAGRLCGLPDAGARRHAREDAHHDAIADERLKAVQDVVRHLMENAVHVGLYTPGWEWVFATRPEVQGLPRSVRSCTRTFMT